MTYGMLKDYLKVFGIIIYLTRIFTLSPLLFITIVCTKRSHSKHSEILANISDLGCAVL